MTKAPGEEASDHAEGTSEATKTSWSSMCVEYLKENILDDHGPA